MQIDSFNPKCCARRIRSSADGKLKRKLGHTSTIEVVQNNAACAVVGAPYRSSATTLRNQLSWQSLQKKKTGTTYRNLGVSMSQARSYPSLSTLPIHKQHQHQTRLSNNGVLIPRAHTDMMSRLFCYTGAVMWNSLPDDINRESTFRTAWKMFVNNSS